MTRARDLASLGDNSSKLEQQGMVLIIPTSTAKGASGSTSTSASGTVTFTGTESISLNGVFSSSYDNYRIVISNMSASASDDSSIRLRKSGTDNTSNIYTREYIYGTGATLTSARGTATSFLTGSNSQVIDLFGPNLATVKTTGIISYVYTAAANTLGMVTQSMFHDLASSADFDGFTFYPNSGTITGKVSVYGYNQ